MRYIDSTEVELNLPDGWAEKVEKAKTSVEKAVATARQEAEAKGIAGNALEELVHKARASAINKKSAVWSDAGQSLRDIMHGKCWYCETYEPRADMPVDHFRPKNNVAECDGKHLGYWWLAFDWTNYRFSCTYCNSRRASEGSIGGKQDHFPLMDPNSRAWTSADDLSKEAPELLDPCDPVDPKLLFFDEEGRAVVNPGNADAKGIADRRVRASVILYHLDHKRLKRERKLIAIKIRDKVKTINDLDAQPHLTAIELETRKNALKEIIRHVRSSAAFCTAARCYLSSFRHIVWVEELIERDY
jgi:uncharacterized protein (TIGR02646 family)